MVEIIAGRNEARLPKTPRGIPLYGGAMAVLTVFSLKGGVGKTSVVLGLTSAAMAKGLRTLVVDLDPQGDVTVGLDVNLETESTIVDVLDSPTKRIIANTLAMSRWSSDGIVGVIPGSVKTAALDVPEPTVKQLKALKTALSKIDGYDLVLIDCPPSVGALTRSALMASDLAAIVTEPGLFSLSAADRALRLIQEMREKHAPDLRPLGVIVNRVKARSIEQSYRMSELKDMFGPLILNPPLRERSALGQSEGAARPIHSWPGLGAAELAADFDKLLARILRAVRQLER